MYKVTNMSEWHRGSAVQEPESDFWRGLGGCWAGEKALAGARPVCRTESPFLPLWTHAALSLFRLL